MVIKTADARGMDSGSSLMSIGTIGSGALLLSQATNAATIAARSILASGGTDATALKTAKAAAKATLLQTGDVTCNGSVSSASIKSNSSFLKNKLNKNKMARQADVVASMALVSAQNSLDKGNAYDVLSNTDLMTSDKDPTKAMRFRSQSFGPSGILASIAEMEKPKPVPSKIQTRSYPEKRGNKLPPSSKVGKFLSKEQRKPGVPSRMPVAAVSSGRHKQQKSPLQKRPADARPPNNDKENLTTFDTKTEDPIYWESGASRGCSTDASETAAGSQCYTTDCSRTTGHDDITTGFSTDESEDSRSEYRERTKKDARDRPRNNKNGEYRSTGIDAVMTDQSSVDSEDSGITDNRSEASGGPTGIMQIGSDEARLRDDCTGGGALTSAIGSFNAFWSCTSNQSEVEKLSEKSRERQRKLVSLPKPAIAIAAKAQVLENARYDGGKSPNNYHTIVLRSKFHGKGRSSEQSDKIIEEKKGHREGKEPKSLFSRVRKGRNQTRTEKESRRGGGVQTREGIVLGTDDMDSVRSGLTNEENGRAYG